MTQPPGAASGESENRMKLQYAGECAHTISFPYAPKTVKTPPGVKDFSEPTDPVETTVKVVFDDKGQATVSADEWRAIKPHASQAGIVRA